MDNIIYGGSNFDNNILDLKKYEQQFCDDCIHYTMYPGCTNMYCKYISNNPIYSIINSYQIT